MKNFKIIICIFLLLFVGSFCINNYNNKIESNKVYLLGKMVCIEAIDQKNDFNESDLRHATYQNTGVVTCVDENNRFISVGHSMADGKKINGNMYEAKSYDLKKTTEEEIGSLNVFEDTSTKLGTIYTNTEIGVTGEVDSKYVHEYENIDITSRFNVKYGPAKIYVDLYDVEKKYFDIEIVSMNYFNNKYNIGIKVVDEDLKNITGGLVQGMSGSPIIQNEKLVGVFCSIQELNHENGYAVFIDNYFK